MHNRLQASRNIGRSRISIRRSRRIANVVRAGEQNDDLGVDSVQLAILQTPEDVLRSIPAPSEISRIPAKEILFPIGQQTPDSRARPTFS